MPSTASLRLRVHSTLPARSAIVAIVFLLAFALAHLQAKPGLVGWLALASFIVAGVGAYRLRKQPNRIVVEPELDEIWVHYRPWLAKRSLCFPLAPFKAVRSFSRGAPIPVTIVELATEEDLPRTIQIGEYEMNATAEAEKLRVQCAQTGIFRDRGFLGEFLERRAEEVA